MIKLISCVITNTHFIFIDTTGLQYKISKDIVSMNDKMSDLASMVMESDEPFEVDKSVFDIPKEKDIFDKFNELSEQVKLIVTRLDTLENSIVTAVINNEPVKDVNLNMMSNHVKHSVESGNITGITALIERIGAMAKKPNHSAQDLVDFLAHTDLPITDQGNIIFYKKVTTHTDGIAYDNYSGLIPQHVGSIICIDPALVDPNRNRDCSHGLHVASLDYARNFYGDAVLIGLVEPEDVIAVPQNDHTKMRVSKYKIISFLEKPEVNLFNQGTLTKRVLGIVNSLIKGYNPDATSKVTLLTQTVRKQSHVRYEVFGGVDATAVESVVVNTELTLDELVKKVSNLDDIVPKPKSDNSLNTPPLDDLLKILGKDKPKTTSEREEILKDVLKKLLS